MTRCCNLFPISNMVSEVYVVVLLWTCRADARKPLAFRLYCVSYRTNHSLETLCKDTKNTFFLRAEHNFSFYSRLSERRVFQRAGNNFSLYSRLCLRKVFKHENRVRSGYFRLSWGKVWTWTWTEENLGIPPPPMSYHRGGCKEVFLFSGIDSYLFPHKQDLL